MQWTSKGTPPLSETAITRFKTRVLVCVALLLLSVVGFSSWSLYSEYRHIIGDAERTSSGYAKALSEHAESALAESDRALRDIIHDVEQRGGLKAFDQIELFDLLSRQATGSPQIGMLFLVNRAGSLYLNSSSFPSQQIQVADREYFKLFLSYPDTELYLSKPLISRMVGRWRFNMIRPIRDPKGRHGKPGGRGFQRRLLRELLHSGKPGYTRTRHAHPQ